MVRRIFAFMVLFWVAGCTAADPVPPAQAQQILRELWQADQHAIWEIDWPAAPVGGPLTVETWQGDSRYRYEILESTAPALVGATLVFDGKRAWHYNRFEPPPTLKPDLPNLSPVTDALTLVERLLSTPAAEARQSTAQISFQPARVITLTYPNGDTLSIWWNEKLDLPVKIAFMINGQAGKLLARDIEPLGDAPEALFGVGRWLMDPP